MTAPEGTLSAVERARLPRVHGRPAIWALLRAAAGPLTTREVWQNINHGQHGRDTGLYTVRDFLVGLERAGIISAETDGVMSKPKAFRLVRDLGPSVPVVNRSGNLRAARRDGHQRVWLAMRVLKIFDVRELVLTSGVSEEAGREYLYFLAAAGYLVVERPHSHHPRLGRRARYRFLPSRNTGPLAPQITRLKALFDPNLGEIVFARRASGNRLSEDGS